MNETPFSLVEALRRYRGQAPEQREDVELFGRFLDSAPDTFERHHLPGHFTGSAWIVSHDDRRVLLTHHRKLNLWLQPGGHADGERDLAAVALREAQEETGVAQLHLPDAGIFDLDRHRIPARGSEPEHWHYDVRFVLRAGPDERFVVSGESHALAWRSIDELARDQHADVSVRRMARKWLLRCERGNGLTSR